MVAVGVGLIGRRRRRCRCERRCRCRRRRDGCRRRRGDRRRWRRGVPRRRGERRRRRGVAAGHGHPRVGVANHTTGPFRRGVRTIGIPEGGSTHELGIRARMPRQRRGERASLTRGVPRGPEVIAGPARDDDVSRSPRGSIRQIRRRDLDDELFRIGEVERDVGVAEDAWLVGRERGRRHQQRSRQRQRRPRRCESDRRSLLSCRPVHKKHPPSCLVRPISTHAGGDRDTAALTTSAQRSGARDALSNTYESTSLQVCDGQPVEVRGRSIGTEGGALPAPDTDFHRDCQCGVPDESDRDQCEKSGRREPIRVQRLPGHRQAPSGVSRTEARVVLFEPPVEIERAADVERWSLSMHAQNCRRAATSAHRRPVPRPSASDIHRRFVSVAALPRSPTGGCERPGVSSARAAKIAAR